MDVFQAAASSLPYNISYRFIPFFRSSEELIKRLSSKDFDVAVADIVSSPVYQHVDFSAPYFEPGYMMVGKSESNDFRKLLWFLSIFKPLVWGMIFALRVFLGAAVWIIERRYDGGPSIIEAILLHGPPCRSIASRMLNVLWLFAILILSEVYTTSLVAKVTPKVPEFNSLKMENAIIGCDGRTQTIRHLVKVLGFKKRHIRTIASLNVYNAALSNGSIKAAFLLKPYADVFLAKHCPSFMEIKPTNGYNLGGFAFVFPKGSRLASDISTAILDLEENGKLLQMEEQMSNVFKCLFEDVTSQPIGARPFLGRFMGITVVSFMTSMIHLLYTRVHAIQLILTWWEHIRGMVMQFL